MRVLACRVDAEESPEALEQFVYGMLDPKMQKYVAKRQPEDIHEALLYAREYEETTAWMGSATRSITKKKRVPLLNSQSRTNNLLQYLPTRNCLLNWPEK